MIIAVDLNGSPQVVLEDADTFTAFSVQVVGPYADSALAGALAGLGRLEGEHVFINLAALKGLAGERGSDAEWLTRLGEMADFARSRGWVDDGGALRAHIERA